MFNKMVYNSGRPIRKVSCEEFDEKCKILAHLIKTKMTGVKYLVGIPRGGLVVATKLSHLTDIPLKELSSLKSDEDNWLLIDDISDSGTTLNNTLANFLNNPPTLTLFIRKDTKHIPDLFQESINDEWIEFPWETKNQGGDNNEN